MKSEQLIKEIEKQLKYGQDGIMSSEALENILSMVKVDISIQNKSENMYEKIKALCKLKKMSINELEKTLDFGRGSLCKWTKTQPGIKKIKMIADFFDISIDKLL